MTPPPRSAEDKLRALGDSGELDAARLKESLSDEERIKLAQDEIRRRENEKAKEKEKEKTPPKEPEVPPPADGVPPK